jgi:hypothetical protein
MKLRSSGIDTSLERACCPRGPIDYHTPLPQQGQTKTSSLASNGVFCCNSSTETPSFQALHTPTLLKGFEAVPGTVNSGIQAGKFI